MEPRLGRSRVQGHQELCVTGLRRCEPIPRDFSEFEQNVGTPHCKVASAQPPVDLPPQLLGASDLCFPFLKKTVFAAFFAFFL